MSLRVACIGAGYFAAFHYDAWSRIEDVDLVASVDRDIARAQTTGLPAYDDAATMLADLRPDIVDIITPPPTHLDTISLALSHQPKAIICQKPFCLDLEQAREATDLAEAAGVPLIIHENFRFQPWYRTIKTAIDAGQIGTPMQLTFRLRPGDGQGERAYLDRQPYFQTMPRLLLRETGVHWIDTFRFLAGTPRRVFADLRRMNPVIAGEDTGYILFDHGGGLRSLFDGNRLADHAATNTRCTMGEGLFEGTEGTLTLRGDGSVHHRCFGALDDTELLPATTASGFGGDCVFHLQSHVAQGLTSGTAFENMARDYLNVIEMEAAAYRSAEEGRWIDL